ncbi:MAG: 4Fe-4S binding protein [Clostridia bacterium]|nr:4Fe-4S binding protein [Clostridia bacterium]
MIRRIIEIDESKCNGCGLCAKACHEGAIAMVNGKAKLMHEHYCDGLGDCLPGCPTGAITFVEREAPAYDEAAVLAAKAAKAAAAGGCPGSAVKSIPHTCPGNAMRTMQADDAAPVGAVPNRLRQWPVQLQLVPVNAPWFDGADLLIAADCCAYARGDFHERFIKDHITLIACPKLDPVDYTEKLTEIFRANDIKSITLTRMTVPCCGGLVRYVQSALQNCGKAIPCKVVVIDADGSIRDI